MTRPDSAPPIKTLLVCSAEDRAVALVPRLGARGHVVTRIGLDETKVPAAVDLVLVSAPPARAEEICRRLTTAFGSQLPLTVLLGLPSRAELERILGMGFDGFIPNDEVLDRRLTVIEQALRTRALFSELSEELKESEARHRSVVASLQEGVMLLDSAGVVLTCNASASRILRVPLDRLIGGTVLQDPRALLRADGTPFSVEALPAYVTLATGKPQSDVVVGLRTATGDVTWLNVHSQPLGPLEPGGTPRSVVLSLTDITALRRSEADLRGLIEKMPDGIAVHRGGKLVFVNPAVVRLFGFDAADELLGRPTLDFVHPEERELVVERIRAAETSGQPSPPLAERLLRRDGSLLYAEVVVLPIFFDGAPAMLAHIRDMTDRRRLEAELGSADRMATVGRLAAAVGHEINNPLAYVVGNLDLLEALVGAERTAESIAEARRLLADARDGAERVRRIVRDLKLFSQRDVEERGPTDVRRVLDSTIGIAWNELRHRARLVKDYGDVPPVHGNDARLGQVFLNLLVNAAQAIPEGNAEGNEVRVTTRLATPSTVTVEISDTGVGMAPEVLARVFEPFFTTKPQGAGTGLGLAICQSLVHALGGEISASSALGRGSSVKVTLPVSSERETRSEPQPSSPRESEPRYRILIIDDEPRVAITLKHLLSEHDVTMAKSGRDAIDILGKPDVYFDAILCDLMMADLTGMDVFEVLKLARPGMEKRMIFMTGGAFTARASAFVAATENATLEKPFPIDELVRAIRKVVRDAV